MRADLCQEDVEAVNPFEHYTLKMFDKVAEILDLLKGEN